MKAAFRFVLVSAAIAALAMLVGAVLQPRPQPQKQAHAADSAPPSATPAPEQSAALDLSLDDQRMVMAAVARRATAHPRTLETYRALREYPGAPPRIPHGLTAEEYRETRCRNCHERGGFVMRFQAYAPIVPHPQLVDCLQCHVPDDRLIGIPLPNSSADALCRQCHAAAAPRKSVSIDWPLPSWPQLATRTRVDDPPVIPHEVALRESCLPCHAGPGAVAEVRTDHPHRIDCQRCHAVSGEMRAALSRGRGAP
jgi:hypothetical protein